MPVGQTVGRASAIRVNRRWPCLLWCCVYPNQQSGLSCFRNERRCGSWWALPSTKTPTHSHTPFAKWRSSSGWQALFWIFQHLQAAIGTHSNRHQMEHVWLTRSQFSHLTEMLWKTALFIQHRENACCNVLFFSSSFSLDSTRRRKRHQNGYVGRAAVTYAT